MRAGQGSVVLQHLETGPRPFRHAVCCRVGLARRIEKLLAKGVALLPQDENRLG
jgi:hypothetical protein